MARAATREPWAFKVGWAERKLDAGQELEECGIECLRRFEVWQVTHPWEADVARTWDLARHALQNRGRCAGIGLASDQQHGDGDAGEVGALVEGGERAHGRAI